MASACTESSMYPYLVRPARRRIWRHSPLHGMPCVDPPSSPRSSDRQPLPKIGKPGSGARLGWLHSASGMSASGRKQFLTTRDRYRDASAVRDPPRWPTEASQAATGSPCVLCAELPVSSSSVVRPPSSTTLGCSRRPNARILILQQGRMDAQWLVSLQCLATRCAHSCSKRQGPGQSCNAQKLRSLQQLRADMCARRKWDIERRD